MTTRSSIEQQGAGSAPPGENGNGSNTENGDAYWTWNPIEYVPSPPPKGVREFVREEDEATLVESALASFGTADSQEAKARALQTAHEVFRLAEEAMRRQGQA